MLDNETKRKIDSARSILVGKVPDPKAQVEQITTALIYKFMDDMDREAQELGGHAKFITGELEAYTWAKLMSKELSGSERLNLYMSALLDFAKSADIPPIFRTIFKDAFLPYRDPETLSLFLKEIDYFDYDHSENLGNAFEYLLSILGSQGDAGQFRTPRHIIDFIVEVLEPKKNETVLDPACGTAGFLISAYKHIMAHNTLTPDEKKTLMHNFTGYDISPDMVRLSLVNMYLHSFPTPKIYEYDTLTSEERWNESFDVILANPPFMTPKGGIRPHNRFSVQANRSEVLFVDYIAEHLNLNGRAGIIVPEGIIFQSANAYKALRKMLIENNFLWAVVSLPAGVFQPYSGVKTSILLLDRSIAKYKDEILFVKVSNDGFDLGAQRREINKNDLPSALEILKKYRLGEAIDHPIAQAVLKSKIAESGDYNLTGDRYRENTRAVQTAYPMVKLGELVNILGGYAFKSENLTNETTTNSLPVIKIGNIHKDGYIDLSSIQYHIFEYNFEKFLIKKEDILVAMTGATVGKVAISNHSNLLLNQRVGLIRLNSNALSQNYLKLFLLNHSFYKYCQVLAGGGAQGNISPIQIGNYEIPLPPLEIQNEIVVQIEEWQKIIDGAKQVINSYRPTITINPDWEMVKLGDVGKVSMCKRIFKEQTTNEGDVPFYKIGTFGKRPDAFIKKELFDEYSSKYSYPKKGDILISTSGTIGKTVIFDGKPAYFQDSNIVWIDNDEKKVANSYLHLIYQNINWMPATGVTIARLYNKIIEETIIIIPPLETQNQIVEQIEKERQAVESCKTLVEIFEGKIKAKIDEVWGNTENE